MKNIDSYPNIDYENIAQTLRKEILHHHLFVDRKMIKGCSIQEINKLEQENNVVFPESYKTFLKYFGHGLGGYVMGDIVFLYNEISGLTDYLRNEELIYEQDPILPINAFVFAMRNYEQYMFFDASGIEKEPPILSYKENESKFVEVGKSIWDIIKMEINFAKKLKNKS